MCENKTKHLQNELNKISKTMQLGKPLKNLIRYKDTALLGQNANFSKQ